MSNVIKSGFVRINDQERKLINAFEESKAAKVEVEEDAPKAVVTRDLAQVIKEKERMLRDEEANLKVKYQHIIEVAEYKADEIITNAQQIAEQIKNDAQGIGREEGYRKGMVDAAEEINAIKEELMIERNSLEEEFNKKVDKFELEFIDIFSRICEKMFGILVDEKKDVIIHIINRTIADLEKSNNYVIRVSREDFELVNNQKQLLYSMVGEGANIEIVESDNLTRNKCLIETDNSVIDCSVDTQVKNLISDLQMLSKI